MIRHGLVPGHACIPHLSLYGLIDTRCDHVLIDMAWFPLLVLPRLLLAFPAMTLALLRAALLGHQTALLATAGVFALYSLPLAGILGVGVRSWKRAGFARSALYLLAVIAIEIIALAWME